MRRAIVLFMLTLVSLTLMGFVQQQPGKVVRVGFYENPPKIFSNDDGAAAGFWVDIVETIAAKEGYRVQWLHGTWEENVARLEAGEIDMLPDVGWTLERSRQFTFSNETVLTSWARIYVPSGEEMETILDLQGKRVAGLEGSLNFDGPEGIKQLARNFDVDCMFIAMDSYEDVMAALHNRSVDAGITNKDFGDLNEQRFNIDRTPIILQPTQLRFAFPREGQLTSDLSARFDRHIREMKTDPTSIYYRALDQYFGQVLGKTIIESIPPWVIQLFLAAAFVVFLLLGTTILTRRQVSQQTAELRAKEQRYRALVENIPDQIFRIDRGGAILDFHAAGGEPPFTPDAVLGRNIREVFLPPTVQLVFERMQNAFQNREMQTHELSLPLDGQARDFEARYTVSGRDEILMIVRDITERNQSERELRESQQRYRTLTTVSPVGIFHTDARGLTIYMNPAWCQISGLTPEQGMGYGWLEAVHPEDREKIANAWKESAGTHTPSVSEYRFLRSDGTVVWVLGQAVPEMDADNQMVGFVGTITDITERKKVESLQLAVARAESADRLKSAFLATMSHELRTPLNSIIGFTGILLQKLVGPLSPEQEKQLGMIQSSARHLLDLINDVLDISKIEAGQLVVTMEEFDLGEAVQKSIEKIHPLAEKKGLVLEGTVSPQSILLASDRRRVEQVLINLLNNAVKFTEKGYVKLHCAMDGDWLVTSVEDSGIGIKEEDMANLFKPFHQVDTGITRQYEGTGLGLSICQRLVEQLGGTIRVESVLGRGSTFTFTLPMKREQP